MSNAYKKLTEILAGGRWTKGLRWLALGDRFKEPFIGFIILKFVGRKMR